MKNKLLKIFGLVLLFALFVTVIVTSIVISNKKKATDNIPDIEQSSIVYQIK